MTHFQWKRSCSGNASCLEVANDKGQIRIRDSKDPDGPELVFTPEEWAAFIAGAKAGEFEL